MSVNAWHDSGSSLAALPGHNAKFANIKLDGLTFSGTSQSSIDFYRNSFLNLNLTSETGVVTLEQVRVSRVGNMVTLMIENDITTTYPGAPTTPYRVISGLPADMSPSAGNNAAPWSGCVSTSMHCTQGGTSTLGVCFVTAAGNIIIYTDYGLSAPNASTNVSNPFSISYNVV